MKKNRLLPWVLALIMGMQIIATPVMASDVSDALFHGIIRVSNNGTSTTNVATNMTLNSTYFIASGYGNSDLSDLTIQANGVDTPFMPGYDDSPWIIFVPTIAGSINTDYDLYSNGVTGGQECYFPDDAGMQVSSDLSIGPSDSFEIEQNVFINVPSGTCNITSAVMGTQWTSPTSFTASAWNNEENAYDDNTGTYADFNINQTSWSDYLELTVPSIDIDSIRYWVTTEDAQINQIDVDVYDGSYQNVYQGSVTTGSNVTKTAEYDGVTKIRMRFYNSAIADNYHAYVNEVYFSEKIEAVAVTAIGVSSGEHIITTTSYPVQTDQTSSAVGDRTKASADAYQYGAAWQAFDDGISLPWATSTAPPHWLQWDFGAGNSKAITYYTITGTGNVLYPNMVPKNWTLQASNDGSTWTTKDTQTNQTSWSVNETREYSFVSGGTRYRYWRLNVTAVNGGGWIWLSELQLMRATLRIAVDGVGKAAESTSFSFPQNSDNWTICADDQLVNKDDAFATYLSGGSVVYMDYTEVSINATQAGYWDWDYGTTFDDQSVNDNDAVPTFRTDSTDADVSASLVSLTPTSQTQVPTFTLTSEVAILTEIPDTPSDMYSELSFSNLPVEPINEILEAGEIPEALWWFPFIFISISIAGFLVYGATTLVARGGVVSVETQQVGSLAAMCGVIEALIALAGALGPIPLWPAFLFPIAALAIIISTKHFSWG